MIIAPGPRIGKSFRNEPQFALKIPFCWWWNWSFSKNRFVKGAQILLFLNDMSVAKRFLAQGCLVWIAHCKAEAPAHWSSWPWHGSWLDLIKVSSAAFHICFPLPLMAPHPCLAQSIKRTEWICGYSELNKWAIKTGGCTTSSHQCLFWCPQMSPGKNNVSARIKGFQGCAVAVVQELRDVCVSCWARNLSFISREAIKPLMAFHHCFLTGIDGGRLRTHHNRNPGGSGVLLRRRLPSAVSQQEPRRILWPRGNGAFLPCWRQAIACADSITSTSVDEDAWEKTDNPDRCYRTASAHRDLGTLWGGFP